MGRYSGKRAVVAVFAKHVRRLDELFIIFAPVPLAHTVHMVVASSVASSVVFFTYAYLVPATTALQHEHGHPKEDVERGMAIERRMYARVLGTKDRDEGLAAFQERRPPDFKGE